MAIYMTDISVQKSRMPGLDVWNIVAPQPTGEPVTCHSIMRLIRQCNVQTLSYACGIFFCG